jgi:hypothetical protein
MNNPTFFKRTDDPTDHLTGRPGQPLGGNIEALAQLPDLAGLPLVIGRPVAQGDLLVLPWPRMLAPVERNAAVNATRQVPAAGIEVLPRGRHLLLADGPRVAWGAQRSASGLTLGTLVVGDNSVAVLSHVEHGDLRIGRGVYVIRRARQALTGPAALPARVATPKAEPDWREAID